MVDIVKGHDRLALVGWINLKIALDECWQVVRHVLPPFRDGSQ
ncbi:hypothetical protein ACFQ3L_04595 [Lacticaseibacillus jixianensis]|uniref:Transposase n=1 Tax=Lacticaseibacillus jixianensis TaxID=2486012 RepID=A0ABW4B7J3_9LACO|nr:hypothetical protein [Lacticaseibacillus jixianensis]